MRWLSILCVCLTAVLLTDCTPRENAAGREAAKTTDFSDASTSAQIHSALLTPGSDALFAAESNPPTTAEGWAGVEAGAHKVIEGAALLQTGSRPAKRPDWVRIAAEVEKAARKSQDAARARNIDALAAADGDFTAQCEDCHKAFRDAGGGMMSKPDQ
jgi:hypothetical protein